MIMEDLKAKGEKASLPIVKSTYSKIVAKKEIDQTIAQIIEHGGQAIYVKGDVTNAQETKANIAKAVGLFGEVTALLHGAGRLADKKIEDKKEQDFDNVLAVKLDGLLTLLQCVDIHNLQHLILFSSVAVSYTHLTLPTKA